MTAPSVFWNFELCWKIFFCGSLSSFTLNVLSALKEGEIENIVDASSIKFGVYITSPYKLQDLPFFLIMGVFGGLLGAMFVHVNYHMGKWRKQYLGASKWKKILETTFWVALTAIIMFFTPMIV